MSTGGDKSRSAKCWGFNAGGRLGTGNATAQYSPPATPIDLGTGRTALAIHAGNGHTCALLDNGTVKCFGYNTIGQIGTGSVYAGSYSPVTVDLGTGKIAVGLGGGRSHTCAILSEGSLKCWGNNMNGSLGLGDKNHRGDNPGEMGDNLPTVKLFASVW